MERKNLVVGSTVAVVAVALLVTFLASGTLLASKTLTSSGLVASANLGLFSDSAGTQPLTSISWGTITPGGSITRTAYVKNIGNAQVTLSMTKTNWNPSTANGPLTVTWNQEGTVLAANQVANAMLTLTALPSISGITIFNVDIVITGTG